MNSNPIGNPFEALLNRLEQIEYAIAEVISKLDKKFNKIVSKEVKDKEDGGMQLAIEITGLKRGTIHNYVNQRTIPHSKVGGRLKFERKELLEWNQKRTRNRGLNSDK
jgi:predicted DNA-binding transcriptional regulator AlpA